MKIKKNVERVYYKKGDVYQYSSGQWEDHYQCYNIVLKDFEYIEQCEKHIKESLKEIKKECEIIADRKAYIGNNIDFNSYLMQNGFVEIFEPRTVDKDIYEMDYYLEHNELPYFELENEDFKTPDNNLSNILKKCMEDNWGGEDECGLNRSIDNINRFLNLEVNLSGADFSATNDGQLEFEYNEFLIIRINWLGLVYVFENGGTGSIDFNLSKDKEIQEQFETLLEKR